MPLFKTINVSFEFFMYNLSEHSIYADVTHEYNNGEENTNHESAPTILDLESLKPIVDTSFSTPENIIFASAAEASICTCPPGTCQKDGCCCSSCPGSMTICAKEEPVDNDMSRYIPNGSVCGPPIHAFNNYQHIPSVIH